MLRQTKVFWAFRVLLVLLVGVVLMFVAVQKGFVHATPAGVTATDFYINNGSDPWGTTFDSQGHLWVAVPGCDPNPTCNKTDPPGKIEEYNASTMSWMQTIQLPAGYGQPIFLAFDSKGELWFPAPMSNALEMYKPSNQTFHKWKVPTTGALPWDVVIDQKGKVWFTEHGSNKIGMFNPTTHVFKEIATPATNSNPYGITVDSHNNIWFTENIDAVALIGEYTSVGKLQEYKIRNGNTSGSGLTPHLITVDHNGNIWWSEGWVGAIAELNISQAVPGTNNGVKEYFYTPPCNSCNGTHTSGIAADSKGNIWFDDSNQSIFGSFNIASSTFTLYNTPAANSHPHDGLNFDSQGNIWFDEEFANKLAVATIS